MARGEGGHDDEDEALGDLFDGAQHVARDAADLAHRERADRHDGDDRGRGERPDPPARRDRRDRGATQDAEERALRDNPDA